MDVSLTSNSAISRSCSLKEFGLVEVAASLGGEDNGRGGGGVVQVTLLLAVVFPLDPPLFNLFRRPAFGVRTRGSLAKVIIS